MDEIPLHLWITAAAYRLQQHWRTVELSELEAVARELACHAELRAMPPAEAMAKWLSPIEELSGA